MGCPEHHKAKSVHKKGGPVGRGLGSFPADDYLIRGLGSSPSLIVTYPGFVETQHSPEEVPHGRKCTPSISFSSKDSCASVGSPVRHRRCTLSAGPGPIQAPAPIHQEAVRHPAPSSF